MSSKACVIFIFVLTIQQICQSLPTTSQGVDGEHKNPLTSYYRHNIFGPNTYAFGFEVNDKGSGNIQFRDERHYANGSTEGSYGYLRPDGSIMVTHYLADGAGGYLSQTENFQPGDELKWQENWPTRKSIKKPEVVAANNAQKLNLTSILLPVEQINTTKGIDLNPVALEKNVLNPAVRELLHGEVPLINDAVSKDNNSLGFETVNKFIPPQFPIVPFELPKEDLKLNLNEVKLIPVLKKDSNGDIADTKTPLPQADKNSMKPQKINTEKSLITKPIKMNDEIGSTSNGSASTQLKSTSFDKNFDWYDKVIKETRQAYVKAVQ